MSVKHYYYKLNGSIFVLMSIVVFPLMGLIYASLITSINMLPLVITIPWLAAFYGYCIACVVKWLFQLNKIKVSIKQSAYVVLAAFIMAYYFHWAFWVAIAEQGSLWAWIFDSNSEVNGLIELLKHPSELISKIAEINSTGTWKLDNDEDLQLGKTKGMLLWGFWLCELLLMLIYPFFVKPTTHMKPIT